MFEHWVSLKGTVDFVKTVTGSSLGPACQTLISICETGEVRARWTQHYSGERPAIHRGDWIGADIDWANFRIVKADGSGMAGVDFSEDDLNHWASKISETGSANMEPKVGMPNEKHPGGRPPEYELVEIKLFFQQLLRDRGDPTNEIDQSPGWKSIADAMKVISDHMEKKGYDVPGNTRFREVLNDVLASHRRALAPLSGN
jgi:hypothetical protein